MKLKFAEAISVPVSERRPVADSINYRSIGISVVDFPLYSAYCIWSFFIYFLFFMLLVFPFSKFSRCSSSYFLLLLKNLLELLLYASES